MVQIPIITIDNIVFLVQSFSNWFNYYSTENCSIFQNALCKWKGVSKWKRKLERALPENRYSDLIVLTDHYLIMLRTVDSNYSKSFLQYLFDVFDSWLKHGIQTHSVPMPVLCQLISARDCCPWWLAALFILFKLHMKVFLVKKCRLL